MCVCVCVWGGGGGGGCNSTNHFVGNKPFHASVIFSAYISEFRF